MVYDKNRLSYETQTVVRLDGKIVGHIFKSDFAKVLMSPVDIERMNPAMWRGSVHQRLRTNIFYFKYKGSKDSGDFFPSLDQCKKSLEVPDD